MMKLIATTDLCDDHIAELQVAKPIGFKDYGGKKSFYGEIVTIKAFEHNPLIRKKLSESGNNKVLVVDGGGSDRCALMGDNIAEIAMNQGWEGVVIYGAIRDSVAISNLNLGLKAMHLNPQKSGKYEIGEVNVPVHFAGIDFIPGHFIYCDADGMVVSEQKYF
jgi:regulator of ribonuclease activity A